MLPFPLPPHSQPRLHPFSVSFTHFPCDKHYYVLPLSADVQVPCRIDRRDAPDSEIAVCTRLKKRVAFLPPHLHRSRQPEHNSFPSIDLCIIIFFQCWHREGVQNQGHKRSNRPGICKSPNSSEMSSLTIKSKQKKRVSSLLEAVKQD